MMGFISKGNTMLVIVDWSLALSSNDTGKDRTYCPKVTGLRGGKIKPYDQMYYDGCLPPHYPVPAIANYNLAATILEYLMK